MELGQVKNVNIGHYMDALDRAGLNNGGMEKVLDEYQIDGTARIGRGSSGDGEVLIPYTIDEGAMARKGLLRFKKNGSVYDGDERIAYIGATYSNFFISAVFGYGEVGQSGLSEAYRITLNGLLSIQGYYVEGAGSYYDLKVLETTNVHETVRNVRRAEYMRLAEGIKTKKKKIADALGMYGAAVKWASNNSGNEINPAEVEMAFMDYEHLRGFLNYSEINEDRELSRDSLEYLKELDRVADNNLKDAEKLLREMGGTYTATAWALAVNNKAMLAECSKGSLAKVNRRQKTVAEYRARKNGLPEKYARAEGQFHAVKDVLMWAERNESERIRMSEVRTAMSNVDGLEEFKEFVYYNEHVKKYAKENEMVRKFDDAELKRVRHEDMVADRSVRSGEILLEKVMATQTGRMAAIATGNELLLASLSVENMNDAYSAERSYAESTPLYGLSE